MSSLAANLYKETNDIGIYSLSLTLFLNFYTHPMSRNPHSTQPTGSNRDHGRGPASRGSLPQDPTPSLDFAKMRIAAPSTSPAGGPGDTRQSTVEPDEGDNWEIVQRRRTTRPSARDHRIVADDPVVNAEHAASGDLVFGVNQGML